MDLSLYNGLQCPNIGEVILWVCRFHKPSTSVHQSLWMTPALFLSINFIVCFQVRANPCLSINWINFNDLWSKRVSLYIMNTATPCIFEHHEHCNTLYYIYCRSYVNHFLVFMKMLLFYSAWHFIFFCGEKHFAVPMFIISSTVHNTISFPVHHRISFSYHVTCAIHVSVTPLLFEVSIYQNPSSLVPLSGMSPFHPQIGSADRTADERRRYKFRCESPYNTPPSPNPYKSIKSVLHIGVTKDG